MGIGFDLSPKESEVTQWMLRGYSAGKLAPKAFFSRRTAEHHVESMKQKLGCSIKAELIQIAREMERMGIFEKEIFRSDRKSTMASLK